MLSRRLLFVSALLLALIVLGVAVRNRRRPRDGDSAATRQEDGTHHPSPSATRQAAHGDAGLVAAAPAPDGGAGDPADPSAGVIARAEDCEDVCGSECVTVVLAAGGELRCPHRCAGIDDCLPGTFCTTGTIVGTGREAGQRVFRCLASNCAGAGENECGSGASCKAEGGGEHLIHRCEVDGERKAGEACADLDYAAVGRCGPDLACLSGRCYPTTCGADRDCPRGSACRAMATQPTNHEAPRTKVCFPGCARDADCPEGDRCLDVSGLSQCLPGEPRTCLPRPGGGDSGCPKGERCFVEVALAWEVRASCARTCTSDAECDGGRDGQGGQICVPPIFGADPEAPGRCAPNCLARADDGGPRGCAEGYACITLEDRRGACVYRASAATDRYFEEHFRK